MANDPKNPQDRTPAPLPPLGGTVNPQSKKEEKKGGVALPLWTSGSGDKLGGMPLFRGAAQRPGSVLGRLKNLKTKDMAFIGAGLAVLVMAPLAEYLISDSNDPDKTLSQGFAQNGSAFPSGTDPSETGVMGLARGGLPGEASDVITPLNARDPSSLIMQNGEKEQASTAASATTSVDTKRDAPKDNIWDKVVSSAKTGATTATRKVGLPKPNVKLAGAINGLRSLSGGSTGASLKLGAPDAKGLFSSPKSESHLAPTQATPGYRGVGSRGLATGTGGLWDGRHSPGGPAGGGGVAGDMMSGGISGGGRGTGFGGGDGDPTKSPSGSSTKDNKTLGESLDFMRKKMEMEKAIDLKWAKKRYDELERKKMIEQTLVQTAQQAFLKVLDKLLEGKKDGAGGGGSGGGGSGSGSGTGDQTKPPADRTANLPTSNNPNERPTQIGAAQKAKPAVDNATMGKDSVAAAAKAHAASRETIGQVIAAAEGSQVGGQGGLGPEIANMLAKVKTAQGTTLASGSGMASQVRVADSKVTSFKEKIEAEGKRMDKEETLATGAVGKLGEHKTEPNTGSNDPQKKEKYTDPTAKVEDRKDTPKAEQPPSAYQSGNAEKAAKEVMDSADKSRAAVKEAIAAMQAEGVLAKIPASAKGPFNTMLQELKNMDAAADKSSKGAKAFLDNMKAVQEATQKASDAMVKALNPNDAAQKQVTEALAKAKKISDGWTGYYPENKIKDDKDPAVKGLTTAGEAAKKAATETRKITQDFIE